MPPRTAESNSYAFPERKIINTFGDNSVELTTHTIPAIEDIPRDVSPVHRTRREDRCVEWKLGRRLEVAAIYGDFSQLGVGAGKTASIAKRFEELLGQQQLEQLLAHFGPHWIDRQAPPRAELKVTRGSEVSYWRLESVVDRDGDGEPRLFSHFVDVTELKAAQHRAELLRQVIDAIPSWVFIKNTDHDYEFVNSSYAANYKISPSQCVGKNSIELGVPKEIAIGSEKDGIRGFWQDDIEVFESGVPKAIQSEPIIVDGEQRFLQTLKTPIVDPHTGDSLLVGFCHDITYLKDIEAQMSLELRHNKTLIQVGRILRHNDDSFDNVKSEICELLVDQLQCDAVYIDVVKIAPQPPMPSDGGIRFQVPIEWKNIQLATLTVDYPKNSTQYNERVTALVEEVASKLATHLYNQQLIAKENFLANHDSLTGLPNRHYFNAKLEEISGGSMQAGESCAVALIDLDGFKQINDSMGHHVGDHLLQAIASRLRAVVRSNEFLARLGGDEFAVLISDIENQDQGIKASQRLLEAIQRPFQVQGRDLIVGASCGVSLLSDDADGESSMLQRADSAMYFAKASGRNQCQKFTQTIAEQTNNRLLLEQDLRRAMKTDGELYLVYQPKYDLRTKLVTGVEALVRWKSSERGTLISPSEFIPVAEESGLILQLSEWIMNAAMSTVAAWNRKLGSAYQLSLNVAPPELAQVNFADRVLERLDAYDFDPKCLDLEVTETFMMQRIEQVSGRLELLRKNGIKISLDDFGTGYSCMSYLQHLPADTLKIDRSFVGMLDFDPQQRQPKQLAITQAIVALAKSAGLQTVAEGIETENQLFHAAMLDVDFGQGYFFNKPMSATDSFEMLKRQESLSSRCLIQN